MKKQDCKTDYTIFIIKKAGSSIYIQVLKAN